MAAIEALVNHYREKSNSPLYPRKDFYRLCFPTDCSTHDKVNWKNKFQQELMYDVGIPKRNSFHINTVYVNRKKPDIIKGLQEGKYGGIKFVASDVPKYRHFILRGFPLDEDTKRLHANLGEKSKHVHKFSRIRIKGNPSTSVRLIWKSGDQDPPKELALYPEMGDDTPVITSEEVEPHPPVCYNCNEKGHVKRWCPIQINQENYLKT